jgi:hypothetical protein
MSWADWKIAHLEFDSAEIATVAAGNDAFLKDLDENRIMKGPLLRRGK